MATIIKPPAPLVFDTTQKSIFLAGSIEMGVAVDWQQTVTAALADMDLVILNPRRAAWDASWPQSIDFGPFREQVEWELEAQERADVILFYFAPETKAPITLLELGLAARTGKVVVCCPAGYWRKGNVDVVCRRYGLRQVETLAELIVVVREMIQ
ncbi:MAG: nucleoside 2-deoxyribosyltransferase domain-containing protein [Blastocatellia bacterium]|nr:nucleoside 2-deoxyribosyltransferase domain-containing protein [Blastocatellia bacterium]